MITLRYRPVAIHVGSPRRDDVDLTIPVRLNTGARLGFRIEVVPDVVTAGALHDFPRSHRYIAPEAVHPGVNIKLQEVDAGRGRVRGCSGRSRFVPQGSSRESSAVGTLHDSRVIRRYEGWLVVTFARLSLFDFCFCWGCQWSHDARPKIQCSRGRVSHDLPAARATVHSMTR